MGVFIGIILIILTMAFQNSLFNQEINKEVVVENREEELLSGLFTDLNLLLRDDRQRDLGETLFFTQNCKENYSKILSCQKRYATEAEKTSVGGMNPPNSFCNAFYKYVENKKGVDGRLTIDELKHLLVKGSSLFIETGMSQEIVTERSFANLLRLYIQEPSVVDYGTMEISSFTESPEVLVDGILDRKKSAEVFENEFRKYNINKYVKYFDVLNPSFNDPTNIMNSTNSQISNEVSLHRDNTFLNNKKVRYNYVGDALEMKNIGIKLFIVKYFDTIIRYRDILLKIKRISPEVDIMLSKYYNGKINLEVQDSGLFGIYEKYYLRYKNLLDALQLSDKYLYILDNSVEIDGLIDAYRTDKDTFVEVVKDLADDEISEIYFGFKVLNFVTPYSSKVELDFMQGQDINNREVCDLSKYSKRIEY